MEENKIGKVGICSIGRIGLIQDHTELVWGLSYIGIALDEYGGSWASRNPVIIADSLEEYLVMKDTKEFKEWIVEVKKSLVAEIK